jgi:hypothetical protein
MSAVLYVRGELSREQVGRLKAGGFILVNDKDGAVLMRRNVVPSDSIIGMLRQEYPKATFTVEG